MGGARARGLGAGRSERLERNDRGRIGVFLRAVVETLVGSAFYRGRCCLICFAVLLLLWVFFFSVGGRNVILGLFVIWFVNIIWIYLKF